MANASHDDSSVPTLLGVSSTDNKTPAIVTVTNNKLDVNAAVDTTGLALETGGNLAEIKTNTDNIPAQGQALAAASLPVVLTADQVTTLTPPAAITGFSTSAKQLPDNHQVTVSNIANTPVITGFATSAKQDTQTTLLQGIAGFTVSGYDYIALTYVAAGNGVGEVQTATFKTGGSGGTTIATLTLAYNASNEISSVTKT